MKKIKHTLDCNVTKIEYFPETAYDFWLLTTNTHEHSEYDSDFKQFIDELNLMYSYTIDVNCYITVPGDDTIKFTVEIMDYPKLKIVPDHIINTISSYIEENPMKHIRL